MGFYETNPYPKWDSAVSKKIKVNTVCFEKTVQSVNDLIIHAPLSIDINSLTGELNSQTCIEIVSKPNLTASLENNVLIIQGLLHVRIIFRNPKQCPCTDEWNFVCQEVSIPIQTVISVKEGMNNHILNKSIDRDAFSIQTNAKVLSTSVFGFPNKDTSVEGKQINLIVKAVLEITVYILKDEIIDLCYYDSHIARY